MHVFTHNEILVVLKRLLDAAAAIPQEEPFASRLPLNCNNQQGVLHWLEQMVTHHDPLNPNALIPFATSSHSVKPRLPKNVLDLRSEGAADLMVNNRPHRPGSTPSTLGSGKGKGGAYTPGFGSGNDLVYFIRRS